MTGSNRRPFVKGILSGSREARFWSAWQQGAIRDRGSRYRLVPPEAMVHGPYVSILFFPAVDFIQKNRKRRRLRFSDKVADVVRAIGDFNSDHLGSEAGLPASRGCDAPPVPSRSEVAQALGLDPASTAEAAATLGHVRSRWGAVARRIYAAPSWLCHMDLGPGTIVLHGGRGVIQDFGRAGRAKIGSDLHTVVRYAGKPAPRRTRSWRPTPTCSRMGGIEIDPKVVREALDAHFAARYRNVRLPSARNADVFAAAVALSVA